MKKRIKRVFALMLSLAMVVMGIQITPWQIKGADGESTNLPTSQEVTELHAPEKAYLCDFRTGSGGYEIVFEDADEDTYQMTGTDEKSFDVYVGTQKVTTVSESGTAVDISSWGFVDGETYEITVRQVLKRTNTEGVEETLESETSAINYFTYTTREADSIDTGIAKVYVTTTRDEKTRNHDLYKSGDKVDVKSSLVVYNADGSIDSEGSGTIKLRGNSTSTGQKKPYNIKFDSKTNVFGFGKAKKWSLLANTFDKALIRNQVGIQFHHKVMEANQEWQFTSECEPIDFYLDGHYMGSYLLLESVEAGSSRVDIDAENPDNHEILLELDMTDRDAAADAHLDAHTTLMNMSFTINEPEGPGTEAANENHEDHQEWLEFNETYAAKKAYTLSYLNHLEEKIQNGGDGTLDEIGQLIDVDSFVNYYITAELFRITDVSYSSVCYFIKKSADGTEKLYAGPLWDLDLSSGNADGAAADPDNDMHAQDNPWFGALMKNKEFAAKVTERFNEVLPEIKKLTADGGVIDTLVSTLRKSIDANYSTLAYNKYSIDATGVNTGWGIDKLYTAGEHECSTAEEARATGNVSGSLNIYDNYDTYLNDFKSYLSGRTEYLKKQFDATDYEEVLTDIEDQMGSYVYNLAKKKEASIYKTCHNEGKLEYLNDGELSNGYLALTNADTTDGWGSENGDPVYATIDLGVYYKAETIDQIVVQYKDGAENDTVLNKAYQIQYSIDGKKFSDIAGTDAAVLDENNRTIDDVSANTGIVRYVRLYFPKQAGYGMQIREFAVLDTDKDARALEKEEVADVTNLTLTVPADNQLGVWFEASVTENVTYIVYVDGVEVLSNATAGEINIINDIKTGRHTVTVETVNANGFISEGVEDTIMVTGDITLEEMAASADFNIAYGTDSTYSAWKEGVNTSKAVTDGIVNNHENYVGIYVDADHNNTGYFQMNLTNAVSVKAIDEIAVWYRDGRGNLCPINIGYQIQYSEDGEIFHTVKTVLPEEMPDENKEQDTEAYVTIDDMGNITSPISTVKSVRIVYEGNVGWGVQVREIAVIDRTGNTGADREDMETEIKTSSDLGITGYQISTNFGAEGETGIRTIYQREELVEGQEISEFGLIMGYTAQLLEPYKEMIIGNDSEFVIAYPATEAGKSSVQMGDSPTAVYYVRTMDIAGGFDVNYSVRAYAELADGSVVYSTVQTFNVFEVAKNLYDSGKMPNYNAHQSLYDSIISKVDSTAEPIDYNWNGTLVNKPEVMADDLNIEGYQMSGSLGGVEGALGLRIVYSVEGQYDEVGLIYGLVYGDTPITEEDMVIGDGNPYVKCYSATEAGELNVQLGASDTAQYYARTMNITGLNRTGYTATYMVRVYGKTAHGEIVYSDVHQYNIHKVAETLYNDCLMSTADGHHAVYEQILKKVNSDYKETDYQWSNTIVK